MITQDRRFDIFVRDNFACVYCGMGPNDGAKLSIDHIVPSARGGSDECDNLATACLSCNTGKSTKGFNSVLKDSETLLFIKEHKHKHNTKRQRTSRTENSRHRLLLRIDALQRVLGISRASIYRWVKLGILPKPIRFGQNSIAWVSEEIYSFISAKKIERDTKQG